MLTSHRARTVLSVFAAVLTFVLAAPNAVIAEEQILAAAPAPSSWDETSGYASVEASRAAASALLAPVAAPSWDETSGYGAVEANRATIGHPATSTSGEAALLAQFRAIELALSRYLGAEHSGAPSCNTGS